MTEEGDSFKLEIELSDELLAAEVAYGISHRAMQLHHNPDDDFENHAEELRDVAWELIEQYE